MTKNPTSGLTWGRPPPLYCLCVYNNTDDKMLLIIWKFPLIRWPSSLEMHILGIGRRAQVRPTCSIFEQEEPGTEPQLNLRSSWACFVIPVIHIFTLPFTIFIVAVFSLQLILWCCFLFFSLWAIYYFILLSNPWHFLLSAFLSFHLNLGRFSVSNIYFHAIYLPLFQFIYSISLVLYFLLFHLHLWSYFRYFLFLSVPVTRLVLADAFNCSFNVFSSLFPHPFQLQI